MSAEVASFPRPRFGPGLCVGLACAALLWSGEARAQVPSLPRSLEVRIPGAYVRTGPSPAGSKRGTLALGARVRPLDNVYAEGCTGPWFRIGDEAWVCGDQVARSPDEPSAEVLPVVAEGALVPGLYGFAREDGARTYATLEQAPAEDWDREFDPHSGLHFSRLVQFEGRQYYQLVGGGYVPAAEVTPARPSSFSGQAIEPGGPRFAWVGDRETQVRSMPGKGRVVARLGRRAAVPLLEQSPAGRPRWVRIGEGEWVRARDLHMPTPAAPPSGLGPDDRWVDVDTETQILTAYEGSRPVWSTLVSTGRGPNSTPRGTFRIWAKLATGEMSDEGEDIDDEPYLMQGVPWVMYFNEGVALHGAYWHDRFGARRSHGCVNLAPRDAAWLFGWARPHLPAGWTGVLPARSEPGSIVVVR
jgi:hypothetical protein